MRVPAKLRLCPSCMGVARSRGFVGWEQKAGSDQHNFREPHSQRGQWSLLKVLTTVFQPFLPEHVRHRC